ncbi:MAG: lipoprotein [Oleiphilaceae bacterium]|nr:lipoprotein [Oleiphilaceae bacterium]
MPRPTVLHWLVILLLLGGCGQKGPLYRETPPAEQGAAQGTDGEPPQQTPSAQGQGD